MRTNHKPIYKSVATILAIAGLFVFTGQGKAHAYTAATVPPDSYPRENGLFPVRPRVALLLVLLPVQSLDAKAL